MTLMMRHLSMNGLVMMDNKFHNLISRVTKIMMSIFMESFVHLTKMGIKLTAADLDLWLRDRNIKL